MTDKKKFNGEEMLSDAELDGVTGGTGDCGKPEPDIITSEEPPEVVTPPIIPPITPGREKDIVNPPAFFK